MGPGRAAPSRPPMRCWPLTRTAQKAPQALSEGPPPTALPPARATTSHLPPPDANHRARTLRGTERSRR